jgi:hypothetical protein
VKETYSRYLVSFVLIGALLFSCRKCPTSDELQGTWIEQEGNYSKLVFSNDTMYFTHAAFIDTVTYTVDRKHAVLWTKPINNPSSGGYSYQLAWHKRKEILTVVGLFPSIGGDVSESNFKKN